MSESLFTSQTPGIANINEAQTVTLGTTVTFAAAGNVTGCRFFAPTTIGGTFEAALWSVDTDDAPAASGTGTLLGTATFGTLTTGAWNTVSFSSAIAVTTGVAYRISVRTSQGRYAATSAFFNSAGLTNGNITANQTGTNPVGIGNLDNGSFIESITTYPNKTFNGNCYFVDVIFDVAGSAFTPTATDTVGLTDAAAAVSTFAQAQGDPLGLTDTAAAASGFARTATDTSGLTDSATTQLFSGFTRTVDDPAGLTDTRALGQAATVADVVGLTDSQALARTATITDTAGLTDSTTVQLAAAGSRQVDDSAGLTDAVTYSSTQTPTDPLGLTDAVVLALASARAATDTLGLADTVAIARSVTVADTAGLTDAVSASLTTGGSQARTITDSVGLDSAFRVVQTTQRGNLGITIRPAAGITTRPSAGVTSRYPLVPD